MRTPAYVSHGVLTAVFAVVLDLPRWIQVHPGQPLVHDSPSIQTRQQSVGVELRNDVDKHEVDGARRLLWLKPHM